jgi:hypothetical protein
MFVISKFQVSDKKQTIKLLFLSTKTNRIESFESLLLVMCWFKKCEKIVVVVVVVVVDYLCNIYTVSCKNIVFSSSSSFKTKQNSLFIFIKRFPLNDIMFWNFGFEGNEIFQESETSFIRVTKVYSLVASFFKGEFFCVCWVVVRFGLSWTVFCQGLFFQLFMNLTTSSVVIWMYWEVISKKLWVFKKNFTFGRLSLKAFQTLFLFFHNFKTDTFKNWHGHQWQITQR